MTFTSKLSTASILAVLAITVNASMLRQTSPLKGCIRYSDSVQKCATCHKRQVTPANGGCGPVATNQPEQRCLDFSLAKYGTFESICQVCKPQYIFDWYKKNGHSFACVEPAKKVANCVQYGFNQCQVCKGGFATDDDDCRSFKDLNLEDANCLWGGRYFKRDGRNICYRCKLGFARNSNGVCVPRPKNEGCLSIFSGRQGCYECNVYEGYSARPGGRCVKDLAPETFQLD